MDKMVPIPSNSIVPERDLGKTPILETHHLGIDFGGLTAVGSVHTPAAPAQQVLDRLIRGNCGYRNRQTNPAPITQSRKNHRV